MNRFLDTDRVDILKAELLKLFLSNNRPYSETTLRAKSELLSDTLFGLPTENISAFMGYVRDNEPTLPTDGRLVQLLRATSERFGYKTKLSPDKEVYVFGATERAEIEETAMKYPAFIPLLQELLENDNVQPNKEWDSRFWKMMSDPENFKTPDHWNDKLESEYKKTTKGVTNEIHKNKKV